MPKPISLVAVCSVVLGLWSCSLAEKPPSDQYLLSKDQLASLLPFAVDFKQVGEPVVFESEIVDPDSGAIYCVGSTSRAFSFSIYVDDHGRPLNPEKETETTLAARIPISVGGVAGCSGGTCTKISQTTSCTPCKNDSRLGCIDSCNAASGCTQFNSCSQSAFGFSTGLIIF